jgi:hypothetical protein
MKPDREQLGRLIRRARGMAEDEPLSNSEIERLEKEIREERVNEMAEAFVLAITRVMNEQFQKVGKVAVYGAIGVIIAIVIAYAVAEYLKLKS